MEVRGRVVRRLEPEELEEESAGGVRRQSFELSPRVKMRSDDQTRVVCEAVQEAGGQAVYEDVVAKKDLYIVYAPQVNLKEGIKF